MQKSYWINWNGILSQFYTSQVLIEGDALSKQYSFTGGGALIQNSNQMQYQRTFSYHQLYS